MTYEKDHSNKVEQVEAAAKEVREAQSYFEFVNTERTVVPCDATWSVIKNYFGNEEVTLAALQECFQNPAFRKMLVTRSPELDRLQSLSTIEEITGSIPTTAKYSTTEQLAEKAAELERRRELNKKSPEELRAIIRAGQPQAPEIVLPAEFTRSVIVKLPPQDLRQLLKRFGSDQVNARLSGR